jgi:hypothetical protein
MAKVPKEVRPMVRQLQDAMMQISLEDVVYVHSLVTPPELVQAVMQVVLLLLGFPDDLSWAEMRACMGNNCKQFHLAMLRLTYNVESIKGRSLWRRINSACKNDYLHPVRVKCASVEAMNFINWVKAVASYHTMILVIKKEIGIKKVGNLRSIIPSSRSSTPRSAASSSSFLSPTKSKRRSSKSASPKSPRGRKQAVPKVIPVDPSASSDEYLSAAMPYLEDCLATTNQLQPSFVYELQSYRRPPKSIKHVAIAVMIVFGVPKQDRDYEMAMTVIKDPHFLDMLRSFDRQHLTTRRIKDFERYVKAKKLCVDSIKSASAAAANIFSWAEKSVLVAKINAEYISIYKN